MFLTGSFFVALAVLFCQRAAAEEFCYNSLVNISCSSDEHIYVENAIIGRLNNSKCYNRTDDEQECKRNIRNQIQLQFLRTNSISISTIHPNFTKLQPTCLGSLPPSFNITHQCRRGYWNDCLEFCVNEKVTFGCLKEESLVIESAFLGRYNNSRCYVRNENEASCNVDIKMALKDRFGENNSISTSMADPFIRGFTSNCPISLSYSLKVSYRCSKESKASCCSSWDLWSEYCEMRRKAVFYAITTLCHGFAVEAPQNTFAVVGQTAFLKCRAANGLGVQKWSFKGSNAAENTSVIIITTRGKRPTTNCERCNVAEDHNGFSVLSFNATTMEDGGSYICDIERDGENVPYGAEMIVFYTNSQCELNSSDKTISGVIMEGNYLEILCNFSFAGNMVPVIKWVRNSHRISLPLHLADNYTDGIHWFHFNATLQLNASDNGMVFGYEVDFERSHTTNSTQPRFIQATNTLSNVSRWNFTAVVWYMARNIRIESVKTIYNFGDRVECSADGNPSPNFTWSCDAGATREGSVLTLDADTFEVDVNYTCRCTAMSPIFSTTVSETVIIRITHETDWKTIKTAILIAGHFIAFLLGAALSAVVIRCKGKAVKMSCQDKNSESIVDDAEMTNTNTSKSTAEAKAPAQTAASVASANKNLPAIKVQGTKEFSALSGANFIPEQSLYTKLEGKKDLPKIQKADKYSTPLGFRSPPAAPIYIEVQDFDSYSDANAHENRLYSTTDGEYEDVSKMNLD